MKKIISLVLAFVMVMSLGVFAFAEEAADPFAPQSGDVTATYIPATSVGGNVYSINVSWTAFEFTYYQASAPTWNPETHEYSDTQNIEEGWGDSEATITVANNSNVHIQAVPSYVAADGFDGITMNFNLDKIVVPSADIEKQEESGSIVVTPSGELSEEVGEATKIGTITVTVSEYQATKTVDGMYQDIVNYITLAETEGWPSNVLNLFEDAKTTFDVYQRSPEYNITVDELVYWWINASNAAASCGRSFM